jgi:MFS family permease
MPTTLLRSLSHRNFRLFIIGQSISLIGTWMQQTAMLWLVYLLTEQSWWLGITTFVGQIPSVFLSPIAGAVVDHTNRRRLVIGTQVASMIQAVIVTVLTIEGSIEIYHILALSIFIGIVNTFDIPGRQAFMIEMIDRREDLPNAIALNSSIFNAARLVGPGVAGFILARTSIGFCFLINALSFVAVIAALAAMRVTPSVNHRPSRNILAGMFEGFSYAFGFPPIRAILLLVAFISLVGVPYSVLLPVYATDILGGDVGTYSTLMVAAGIGALVGALLLASRKTILGLGRWITFMPMLLGIALIGMSLVRHVIPAFFCIGIAGFAIITQMASSNTVLQTIVEEDKRGRVMSLYAMSFMGIAPFGSLAAGYLADHIGAPLTARLAGVGCILASLVFALQFKALRRLIRPIYRQMGILPEVATGIQQASQLATPPEGK